ncbi:hypothetical protein ACFLYU_03800 [Candidatus Dependentiae bacterium]
MGKKVVVLFVLGTSFLVSRAFLKPRDYDLEKMIKETQKDLKSKLKLEPYKPAREKHSPPKAKIKYYDKHIVTISSGWVKVRKLDVSEKSLLKKDKKSRFFNFNVSNWASHKPNFVSLRRAFVFVDIDKGVKPIKSEIDSFFIDNTKKKFSKLSDKDFKGIQKEGIGAMGWRYKIHLQVKEEYLNSFVKDFTNFVLKDERCKYIFEFKYPRKVGGIYKEKKNAMPMVVVYVSLLPGSKKEKNKILKPIVDAIVERYAHVSKKIDLKIPPRYSRKIKDFIYIAGGDGDDKKYYLWLIEEDKLKRNLIYTKDYVFFKGYEFDYKKK